MVSLGPRVTNKKIGFPTHQMLSSSLEMNHQQNIATGFNDIWKHPKNHFRIYFTLTIANFYASDSYMLFKNFGQLNWNAKTRDRTLIYLY